MTISILTLFPDYFTSIFKTSIIGKAVANQKVSINLVNLRDFATDSHKTTDDRPFGGGAGMVLKLEPILKALQKLGVVDSLGNKIENPEHQIFLTSASGQVLNQNQAKNIAKDLNHLILICGHYEGIDQRVIDNLIDAEVRIGDYVLTGGEPAAAVIADSIIRLLPEVLGNQDSLKGESHDKPNQGSFPQYTRPAEFSIGSNITWPVPDILLSGDHQKISEWRETNRKKL